MTLCKVKLYGLGLCGKGLGQSLTIGLGGMGVEGIGRLFEDWG